MPIEQALEWIGRAPDRDDHPGGGDVHHHRRPEPALSGPALDGPAVNGKVFPPIAR